MKFRVSSFFHSALFLVLLASGCSGDDANPYRFEGLSDEVEIVVDDRGIPHIYAANDVDLMFAAGRQMAVDRLFEMDLMRRRAIGRRAEVLGADYLGQDQLIRRVDIPGLAEQDLRLLTEEDPELRRMLEAWVAGVNSRIEAIREGEAPLPYGFGPDELDYEPELWTIQEAMAVPKLILFGNGSNLEFDILATALENQSDALDAIELPRPAHPYYTVPSDQRPAAASTSAPLSSPPEPTSAATRLDAETLSQLGRLFELPGGFDPNGSNNWAVSGAHTDNGRSIICGDPHQPLDSPSLFYAHHLNSKDRDGTMNVAGFSFVGAPLVHLGHTEQVAWTATTNFADQMDIWAVSTDTGNAVDFTSILVDGEEVRTSTRTETFHARRFDDDGAPLPMEMSERKEVVMHDVPGRGVLLDLGADLGIPDALATGDGNKRLLFNWVGMKGTTESLAWVGYNRAETVEDVETSLDEWGVLTSFNWIAADQDDITYRVRMEIPDRDLTQQPMPTRVMDGQDGSTFWTGDMLTDDKLPAAKNPERGYLATANNDPWGFTEDGDITNDPWYYGSFYAPGYRAKRIHDELERLIADGPVTAAQMEELQLDVHSQLAEEWVPLANEAWAATTEPDPDPDIAAYAGDPDIQELVEQMAAWDEKMTRDSAGALAFHVYAMFLTGQVLEDDLGSLLYPTIVNANGIFVLKIADLALRGEYPMSDAVVGSDPNLLALQALEEAVAWFQEHFGGVDPSVTPYTWGDAHGTYFDMPWDDADRNRQVIGFVPTRGGEDTVNPSNSQFLADDSGTIAERFDSNAGPIYRMVTTFDADGRPRMRVNFPPGNAGDPDSPHFDDTLDDWLEGRYSLFPFTRSEVDGAAESSETLPVDTER
ncbi:MAG: penicillin acylase family protein [Myxococcota bacterium]